MNKYRISYSFTNMQGKNPRMATYDVDAETEDMAISKLKVECKAKDRKITKYNYVKVLK